MTIEEATEVYNECIKHSYCGGNCAYYNSETKDKPWYCKFSYHASPSGFENARDFYLTANKIRHARIQKQLNKI